MKMFWLRKKAEPNGIFWIVNPRLFGGSNQLPNSWQEYDMTDSKPLSNDFSLGYPATLPEHQVDTNNWKRVTPQLDYNKLEVISTPMGFEQVVKKVVDIKNMKNVVMIPLSDINQKPELGTR